MKSKLSPIFFLLATMFVVVPIQGQQNAQPDCKPLMQPGQPLITIPKIEREQDGILRGWIVLSDEGRAIPSDIKGNCYWQQHIRFFKGFSVNKDLQPVEPSKPWPNTGAPLPGPTLRARVGDLIELAFLNQIDISHFPNSLDQGQHDAKGCDIVTAQRKKFPTQSRQILPRNDTYPNCLHGSSTANLHFHGTHTTPSTTGDNVLLFIRPALRDTGKIEPGDDFVRAQFKAIFNTCEKEGSPRRWDDLPESWAKWKEEQERLLRHYDETAPYQGQQATPGHPALPASMQLWPKNDEEIRAHKWPQYSIGAYPYCFRLPTLLLGGKKLEMYQAPGTHWYHAHKHGSTALNVGNGMTGALIIEGDYDTQLKKFYEQHESWKPFVQQVLVIQQLEASLNLMSPGLGTIAPLTVNGGLNPVITMKPNQVQLWRIINGAARSFVQFHSFTPHGKDKVNPTWRQIAQDGVQFHFENYKRFGKVNEKFNLATANRADLLVKAPAEEGSYELQVVTSVSDVPAGSTTTLLTVQVKADDNKIDPPMDFIKDEADFPRFPPFLKDLYKVDAPPRTLTFNTDPFSGRDNVGGAMPLHKINNKQFQDGTVDQCMTLNTVEEWTVKNQTVNIAHPFHIHINPFQIVEVFQPNSQAASDPRNKECYADPTKPETWKPCEKLEAPWVWWDTFAIPTARNDAFVCQQNTCPASQGTACTANTQVCTVGYPGSTATRTLTCSNGDPPKCPVPAGATLVKDCSAQTACTVNIPGYFKLRSHFADFTGEYVLHCHILAHEDRGMMELVAVESTAEECKKKTKSDYTHH